MSFWLFFGGNGQDSKTRATHPRFHSRPDREREREREEGVNFWWCGMRFGRRQLRSVPPSFQWWARFRSGLLSLFAGLVNLFPPSPPFFFGPFFHTESFQVRHRKRDRSPFFDRVRGTQTNRGNFHACVCFRPLPQTPILLMPARPPRRGALPDAWNKFSRYHYYYTGLPANWVTHQVESVPVYHIL